jgi:hypothetical protein
VTETIVAATLRAMATASIDHPILAVLASLSALPFGWPIIRAFARSTRDDIEEAIESPLLSYFGWFPEWTFLKFFWLVVILAAVSVAFYKLYTFVGGLLGMVA